MQESFSELFEHSPQPELHQGSLVKGQVVAIDDKFVTVNAGLKSEGIIPIAQFHNLQGELEVAVGDEIEVAIESIENGFGETILSRERAKRIAAWNHLVQAHEKDEIIEGVISGKVKGGFIVDVDGIRAFLPGSLLDTRPLRDTTHLENKVLEFKLIKIDEKRNNIVVSRRAVVEAENNVERAALLENLEEGQKVKGIVKNLTDYGAFVDLGGIDGLLHITDISWKRINHPSEALEIGDEIDVQILKFDREKNRVSLGMKQLKEDPWQDLIRRHPQGGRLFGKVSTITEYGCFVEIEEGIEGLVHVSEMDWTNKNINPRKVVSVGDEVEVMVLEVDEERRRISLGLKQCIENPWTLFGEKFKKGDKVTGKIRSITDFGIFVGLDNNIDGLIHVSDISWATPGEEAIRNYQKGQEIEAVILVIDAEKERISLGIKQMSDDPFSGFSKGSLVTGTIKEVDAKLATVDLGNDVIGHIKAADVSKDKINDVSTVLKVGESVEARILNVDRKMRVVNLSIKAKEEAEQKQALKDFRDSGSTVASTTLGDLLKEQIDEKDGDE